MSKLFGKLQIFFVVAKNFLLLFPFSNAILLTVSPEVDGVMMIPWSLKSWIDLPQLHKKDLSIMDLFKTIQKENTFT